MGNLDYDAQLNSVMALGIIFIITISLSALALIIKLVKQPNAVYDVRRIMVIILTFGTLLLALFPLIVSVRERFAIWSHDNPHITCRTRVLSTVYEMFYFPFVYAFGLITLAVELYVAFNRKSSCPPPVALRIVYVCFPWLFGVILVLPLTLAGIEFDTCRTNFTMDRYRAQIWVCSLLPSIAVLLAIFLACKVGRRGTDRVPTSSSSTQRVVNSSSSHGFQQASYNSPPPMGVGIPSAPTHPPDSSNFQSGYEFQSGSPPLSYHSASYQHHQPYHHQQHQYQPSVENMRQPHQYQEPQPPQHYPPPPPQYGPPPNYAPPPPGFGAPYYGYEHSVMPHQMNMSHSHSQMINGSLASANGVPAAASSESFRDFRKETMVFVKVAVIFYLCSIPYAIYTLATYQLNKEAVRMDSLTVAVINNLIYWLTVLRWLLLCVSWLILFK